MAQFNKTILMTITSDDRAWLSFGNFVLAQIKEKMDEEGAECIMNTETGEIIEKEDIKKTFWTIDSLLDSQEAWKWELI